MTVFRVLLNSTGLYYRFAGSPPSSVDVPSGSGSPWPVLSYRGLPWPRLWVPPSAWARPLRTFALGTQIRANRSRDRDPELMGRGLGTRQVLPVHSGQSWTPALTVFDCVAHANVNTPSLSAVRAVTRDPSHQARAVRKKTSSELAVTINTGWVSTNIHRWLLYAKLCVGHRGHEMEATQPLPLERPHWPGKEQTVSIERGKHQEW